jgi:TolB protein
VIAFASDRGSGFDIYTVNAADGSETQVTTDPAPEREPAWSPDGSRIALQSEKNADKDVFVMNADGSNPVAFKPGPGIQGGPRWSPDGAWIAYYNLFTPDIGFLWLGQVDGPDNYPPLRSYHPADPEDHCGGGFPGGWLDADTVVFRGSWGEGSALEICVVNRDESGTQPIFSQEDVYAYYPAVSPADGTIAFSHQASGQTQDDLWIMSPEGRNPRLLFETRESDSYPSWSPDGEWIAFSSNMDGDSEIYAIRKDGTDLRQLTDNEHEDLEPAWRPATP